jgi:serine/threonine-protein kinase
MTVRIKNRRSAEASADVEPSADRNLVFGILALQMDFINRDGLIEAMHAWVLDKTKSLGEILLDRGALSRSDFDALETLVQRHLRRHGDDPKQSLAAVNDFGAVRDRLEQIADAELHASLAHVSRTSREDQDACATVDRAVRGPTSAEDRFRVLRPHARGGLGEVSVALDVDLRRQVALKEIRAEHADEPDSRSRFLREAEITGNLEHPGIVPVYALGHYADGRPFYTMRLIKGDSLLDAIRRFHEAESPGRNAGERMLALRQLLGRFVAVCNAVAFGHARGVIHRDLKPANVMLGDYGETLVVDWGLAKAVGRADGVAGAEEGTLRPIGARGLAPTAVGAVVGTPQFMAPEQAAGWLHVGPAGDIYSLGATLYCLLRGQPPVDGPDLLTMLDKVQRGDFPPPRRRCSGSALTPPSFPTMPPASWRNACSSLSGTPDCPWRSAGSWPAAMPTGHWCACARPSPKTPGMPTF